MDGSDVEVVNEQEDVGPGVGSADADVAELACDAQGDGAGLVDLVVADAVVGVSLGAGGGLRAGVVGGGWGGGVGERAVRTSVVVLAAELVEVYLEIGERARLHGLGA